MRKTLALLFIATAALVVQPAWAGDLQLQVLAASRSAARNEYSFKRTTVTEQTGKPRRTVVEQFDPRRPANRQWLLVSVDGRAPTADERAEFDKSPRGKVPSYTNLSRWIGSDATKSDASPGYVSLRFKSLPAGTLMIASHDASADAQAQALVNTKGKIPFVERVQMTSDKGFTFMLMVSVQHVAVGGKYALDQRGRPVPAETTVDIQGTLLGKSTRLKTVATFSDFQPVS